MRQGKSSEVLPSMKCQDPFALPVLLLYCNDQTSSFAVGLRSRNAWSESLVYETSEGYLETYVAKREEMLRVGTLHYPKILC